MFRHFFSPHPYSLCIWSPLSHSYYYIIYKEYIENSVRSSHFLLIKTNSLYIKGKSQWIQLVVFPIWYSVLLFGQKRCLLFVMLRRRLKEWRTAYANVTYAKREWEESHRQHSRHTQPKGIWRNKSIQITIYCIDNSSANGCVERPLSWTRKTKHTVVYV